MAKSISSVAAAKSEWKRKTDKPKKPYKGFPLFPHATRRWAKKIRGQHHYFAPWDDPDGALRRYLDQQDDLLAGRKPRGGGRGLTICDLGNRFLTSKQHLLDTDEITPRTFYDYKSALDRVVAVFGKSRIVDDLAADDFEHMRKDIVKTRGPVALGNEIQRVRMIFKFELDQGLIERPVRYGQSFRKPSRKTLRKARVRPNWPKRKKLLFIYWFSRISGDSEFALLTSEDRCAIQLRHGRPSRFPFNLYTDLHKVYSRQVRPQVRSARKVTR